PGPAPGPPAPPSCPSAASTPTPCPPGWPPEPPAPASAPPCTPPDEAPRTCAPPPRPSSVCGTATTARRSTHEDHRRHHLPGPAPLGLREGRDRRGRDRLGRTRGRRPRGHRLRRRRGALRLPDRPGPGPHRGPVDRDVPRRLLPGRAHPDERDRR